MPSDHPSGAIEDYLDAIYNMKDEGKLVIAARLAERLGVTPPTVSQTLRRMVRDGLITIAPDNEIHFTAEGKATAEATIRRHRMLERFLTDMLGLEWAVAHGEAHRLQRSISDIVEERLFGLLGQPTTCPHGNPIPGSGAARLPKDAFTLDHAETGQKVVVDRITEEGERDLRLLEYFQRNRLMPGVRFTITEVAPWNETITLSQDSQTVILGMRAARTIWVHPVGA
jgi:DtxR family Mn-dependent transcriptional regulator